MVILCYTDLALHAATALCAPISARPARTRNNIDRDERNHRHALCPLAHGLPAHRGGANRAVQLALYPRPRRENVAADRGYRPRTLHPGRDRTPSLWPTLARSG